MSDTLLIRTLGRFSVSAGDKVVSENSSRSNKVWKIFKYLITYRYKMVPVETLIEMLWPDSEPENPQKSLYTVVSRLRKALNERRTDVQYILFQHNCYQWNPQVDVELDVAEFETLLKQARSAKTEKEKMQLLQQATEIYDGDYMAESAFEMWAMPVTNHYKRLYLRAVENLADIYVRFGMHDENSLLLSKAIAVEPFEESIHERLIHVLCVNGETSKARLHYDRFVKMISTEIGALPSEEFQTSCKNLWNAHGEARGLDAIKSTLDMYGTYDSAYFCSSDTFTQIYQLDKRADKRMKFPVFLALITISDERCLKDDSAMKLAMILMRQCLMDSLRRGDVVSQFSKNQFLLMLSARLANDAEAALVRIERLYSTKYARTPCRIQSTLAQVGEGVPSMDVSYAP